MTVNHPRRSTPTVLHLLAVAVPVLLLSCADGPSEPPPPPPPASAAIHGGDGQTVTVATVVPQAPAIQVRDAAGNAAAQVAVSCVVSSGGGSVSGGSATTNATGIATIHGWLMGTQIGENTLTCTVANLAPVVFTATATAAAAASAAAHAGDGQQAQVTAVLPVAPAVRVRDTHGNPVGGATVICEAADGGSLERDTAETGADGVATLGSWTLGTAAGAQALHCAAADVTPVTFTATAVAGPAATLAAHAGNGQSATVATTVPVAPAVLVTDAWGNRVAGTTVTCAVTAGGGTLSGATAASGADGIAAVESWALGTKSGANSLGCTAAGLEAVAFGATGIAGPATSLALHSGNNQKAAPGAAVAIAPAVQIHDQYANPVAGGTVSFALTVGGSVTNTSAVADSAGIASAGSWTLAPFAGPNTLVATVTGLEPVSFSAIAEPDGGFFLYVDGVHLNQGVQNEAGTVGAVAGRPGLLRVVVRASMVNRYTPAVRVRLFQDGALLREALIPARRNGVPTGPDLDTADDTWNLALAAAEVVEGLSVEAVVDPGGEIDTPDPGTLRFPRQQGATSLGVVRLAPLRVVFFPVFTSVQNTLGSVTDSNIETFLQGTRQLIPVGDIIASVRPPFNTDRDLSIGSQWSSLLGELQAVRTIEGAVDEYYHGIIGDFSGIPYGGLAYRPSLSTSTFRSGLSYDRMPWATTTIAHELGHNMGRMHAPCGNPGGPDPNFPHAEARLGGTGWDVVTGDIFSSRAGRDYMSYCSPRWTSDYTFAGILQWRRTDPWARHQTPGDVVTAGAAGPLGGPATAGTAGASYAAATAGAAAAPTRGVLVWGRVGSDGVTLNPAFALEAPPALPVRGGPNVLTGRAADGRELFRFSFDDVAVEDGADPDERHFVWFVPLDDGRIADLATLEVTTPRGTALRHSRFLQLAPGVAASVRPDVRLESAPAGRVRLRWNAGDYPMALVRDAATGRVLSFGRRGDMVLVPGATPPARIEVILSDGVRSETWQR